MSASIDDLGKQVRLNYADGSVRAVGKLVAHSIVPSVCVETEDGNLEWWRCDMVVVLDDETATP